MSVRSGVPPMTAYRAQHGASGLYGGYGGLWVESQAIRPSPNTACTYGDLRAGRISPVPALHSLGCGYSKPRSTAIQGRKMSLLASSIHIGSGAGCCRSSRRWSVPISSASDQYCGRDCRRCCGREPRDRIEHRWIMLWITLGIMPLTRLQAHPKLGRHPPQSARPSAC